MLRKHGVVGKFVEFYGPGVAAVPLANRATIGNMSPEYGSTCAIFPIDDETLSYLRLTGRADEQVALVEAYAKEQGLWHDPSAEPRLLRRPSSSTSRRSCRRSPARSGRRTGCRSPTQGPLFRAALADYVSDHADDATNRRQRRRGRRPSRSPASDPIAVAPTTRATSPHEHRDVAASTGRPSAHRGDPRRRHDLRRSTTAPSSSRRSRAAPTPPTRS